MLQIIRACYFKTMVLKVTMNCVLSTLIVYVFQGYWAAWFSSWRV